MLISLALLGAAAFGQEPPPEPVLAVVAVQTLPRGHVIDKSDLALVALDEKPRFQAFDDPEALIGQVVKEDILVDELVRVERLAIPADPRAGLEARIPRGDRVLAVRPRLASDPVGPGDHADVWWGRPGTDPECWLAPDIPVLAAINPEGGASTSERNPSTLWLALDVSPDEALLIVHGDNVGEIVLRARADGAPPLPEDRRCHEPMSVYLR